MRHLSSRTCILTGWLFVAISGYAGLNILMAQKNAGNRTMGMLDDNSTSASQLKVIEITPKYDGKSYCGRFKFTNSSNHIIEMYGSRIHVNGPIRAAYLRGEIFEGGVWKSPKVFSDAIPLTVAVAPGENVEVLASLPFDEKMGGKIKARVRWSQLVSDIFVIDWQSDRKTGKFEFAHTEHIKKLRCILAKMGFNEQLLHKDDFWSKFIEGICCCVGDTKGFPPFRTKHVLLPEIGPDDGIEYRLWADDISDHEYIYQLDVILAPSEPLTNWLYSPQHRRWDSQISERGGPAHRKQVFFTLGDSNGVSRGSELALTLIPPTKNGIPSAEAMAMLHKSLLNELRRWCPSP